MFQNNYQKPGPQANAVRAYLEVYDGVEPSWSDEWRRYQDVMIAEWHNGRERGWVVMFRNADNKQLNIAFYEHRNSDEICAIKWVQSTMNPPTIETAKFGDIYKDKYDVSHSVSVGQPQDMAIWIYEKLCDHWNGVEE